LLALVHRRIAAIPWAARYWRMYRRAEQVNRSALAWLADRRSDAVFLFLNYMEPHRPWTAPGLRYDAFAAEPDVPPTALRAGAVGADGRPLVDLYDSQVAALDHALGDLFAGLRRLGLWDRALVVVTADHGESLGEHGVVGHGQSLHEPELVVPLLVKYPGSQRTGRRAARVQLVDVLPSVLAELGLDVPPGLDGGPLDAVAHPILAEFYTDPRAPEDVRRGYQAALYDGAHKLFVDDAGRAEVVDIENDPSESRPLPPPFPGALAEREAWLLDRQRTLEETLRARATTIAPVDPQVEKALRALGYVGK
jgi:arylsulfatase A-like enzyme